MGFKRCSDVIINVTAPFYVERRDRYFFHIQRDIILHIRGTDKNLEYIINGDKWRLEEAAVKTGGYQKK